MGQGVEPADESAGISTAYDVPDRQTEAVSINRCASDECAKVPSHVEAFRQAVPKVRFRDVHLYG